MMYHFLNYELLNIYKIKSIFYLCSSYIQSIIYHKCQNIKVININLVDKFLTHGETNKNYFISVHNEACSGTFT